MKLILYDKCLDAILKLPRHAQKKVTEFMRKFHEDSRSAAIHLEPISIFKDPQLRTARLDQKYRVIIRVPESGEVYYLLWVDNHDEAMAWAANKLFAWNENTQSHQVFVAPEAIAPPADAPAAPSAPASVGLMDKYADEELLQIGVPAVLLPAVRKLDSLSDLEALEQYIPVEAFENLFALFDGLDIQALISEVAEGKVASDDFEAQMRSANNQRSFFELTSDEQLNQMLSGELQKWKIYLHPSQRALVDGEFPGSVRVSGGAGTGKTVAALHRLRLLLSQDVAREGQRVLFTTFTKSLTRNLAKELPGLGIAPEQVLLINIDAFALEEATRLQLVPAHVKILDFPGSKRSADLWEEVLDYELSEFDSRFLDEEYKQVILYHHLKTAEDYYRISRIGRSERLSRKGRMEVWRLAGRYEGLKAEQGYADKEELFNRLYDYYRAAPAKPFSHVIADEIQDFSNVELRLLRALVAEKPNDLFLVGDPLQQIYSRSLNFTKAGINIRGRRSRRLKINYRTTEEIRRTALAAIQNISFDNFDGEEEARAGYVSLRRGPRPSYELFSEKGQELDYIIHHIQQYADSSRIDAFDYSDICIAARLRSSVKDIRNRLHLEGLPYYDLTTDTGSGNRERGIRLSTFHNLKGLEFKALFLMDVNRRTLPYHPQDWEFWGAPAQKAHEKQERALAYVAMTRAIHVVHLTGVGERSGCFGG